MKAYINENNLVVAIGIIDDLFPNCEPIEITEEEKLFIEACKLPKRIDGVFVESFSLADENAIKIQKAIEIDLYYTKKISDLMIKHNDKLLESFYNDTIYVIPQSALDAKQALKDECNAKILELGITDFTYRQSVPKLAKF